MKTIILIFFLFIGITGYSQIGNKEIIMDLSKPELRAGTKMTEKESSVNDLSEEVLKGYSKEIASNIAGKIKMNAPDKISNKILEGIREAKAKNPNVSAEDLKSLFSDIIFKEVKNVMLVDLAECLPNELDKILPQEFAKKVSGSIVGELPNKISNETAQRCYKNLSEELSGMLTGNYQISNVTSKIKERIIEGLPEKTEKELNAKLLEGSSETSKVKKAKSKWLSIRAREMPHIKIINGNPLKYNYKIDTEELVFFSENVSTDKAKSDIGIATAVTSDESSNLQAKIDDLINSNVNLDKKIVASAVEFELFYADQKGRNSLDFKEIEPKRKDFLDKASNYNNESDKLLNDLDVYKDNNDLKEKYMKAKSEFTTTKDKAKKLKDEITKKLYGFDFATFTLPIDVQGKNIDGIEFRLRRFDKETKEEDTGFAPHPYTIWIRGGIKIDVSAGLFFTSLFDDAFDKKDDPVITDNKIIIKKNQGDYDFAFGSSINAHSRWNSWLNMGGNLGVAFTTNQKFQILTGANFILGRQERIIVTAGLTMGKVDRLANSYKEGGSYNLGAEGTIPMESQFKFGHFFGVTYNLSKVKKISLEKGIEQ